MIKVKSAISVWIVLLCVLMMLFSTEAEAQTPGASCTVAVNAEGIAEWSVHYRNLPDISNGKLLLDSTLKVRYLAKPIPGDNILFDAIKPSDVKGKQGYCFPRRGGNQVSGSLVINFVSVGVNCDLDLAYREEGEPYDHACIEKLLPEIIDESGKRILTCMKYHVEMMAPAGMNGSPASCAVGGKKDFQLVKSIVLHRY